jgi:hypothetical protein
MGDGTGAATKYSQWVVTLADGTVHALPSTDASYSGASCSGGFTDQTIDGSGYTLSVTGATVNSIYASNGTSLSGISIQDSNGNAITYNSTTTKWTDSLGIVALVGSSSSRSWNWTDVNGGSPTASWTLTPETLKTQYLCSGITD